MPKNHPFADRWNHNSQQYPRVAELIADSAAGRLIRPQRYGDIPKWARSE